MFTPIKLCHSKACAVCAGTVSMSAVRRPRAGGAPVMAPRGPFNILHLPLQSIVWKYAQ